MLRRMKSIPLEQFEKRLKVLQLTPYDHDAIVALQQKCFPGMPTWTRAHVESQIERFSEGQIGIEWATAACACVCARWRAASRTTPFHPDAVAAECTPNIETIVMKDLDIELLRRHRYLGTKQNWRDRRRDLYRVRYREDGEEREV